MFILFKSNDVTSRCRGLYPMKIFCLCTYHCMLINSWEVWKYCISRVDKNIIVTLSLVGKQTFTVFLRRRHTVSCTGVFDWSYDSLESVVTSYEYPYYFMALSSPNRRSVHHIIIHFINCTKNEKPKSNRFDYFL